MRRLSAVLGVLGLSLLLGDIPAQGQTDITLTGSSCISCMHFAVAESSLAVNRAIDTPRAGLWGTPPAPEMIRFTLLESRAVPMTYAGHSAVYALPSSGAFDIHLIASGLTLAGALNIQNPHESFGKIPSDRLNWGDFDSMGAGFGGVHDEMIMTLHSHERIMEHHPRERLNGIFGTGSLSSPPVSMATTPEPMSMLLFGTGLLVLGGTLRRRQRRAQLQH